MKPNRTITTVGLISFLSLTTFSTGVVLTTAVLLDLPIAVAAPLVVQSKQPREEQVFEENNIKFELQNCQRKRQKVVCNLMITAIGDKDISISIYANFGSNSRVFDTAGNEYVAKLANMGNAQNINYASANIIKNIPVKANLTFELPQQISSLAVLEVAYESASGNGKVQFRKVKVDNL